MATTAFRWSGLVLTVGAILLGAGIVMVAFGAGIVLVAGTLGFFVAFFVGDMLPQAANHTVTALLGILLGLGFAWVGVAMLHVRQVTSHESSRTMPSPARQS